MTIDVESNGQTLEELNNQIERRVKVLGNTTKEATTAIVIDTLLSLRAATKKSSGKMMPPETSISNEDLGLSIQRMTEYHIGFRYVGGKRKGVILDSADNIVNLENVWWQLEGNTKNARVYLITLSSGRYSVWGNSKATRHKQWYLISYDYDVAVKCLHRLYEKLVKYTAGLKKSGLTKAMIMASGKSKALENRNFDDELQKNIIVTKTELEHGLEIEVQDNLYNSEKIAGGAGAVQAAMQKALNSTNGYVNAMIERYPEKYWFTDIQKQQSPFPKGI